MAISCNTDDLAAQAKCFKCLGPATQIEIQTYLIARLAGAGTDTNALQQAARKFQVLSPATLQEIKTMLLCKLAGGT